MIEEKILTQHSQGKSGKNISKQKYETVAGLINRPGRRRR